MKTEIDFMLAQVLPEGFVTGRNCGNDLLPIGTQFTAVVRRVFPIWIPGTDYPIPEPERVGDVSLRLDKIEWYGRSVEFLDPSHTAKLNLSGEGLPLLVELLAGADQHTHYSIVAKEGLR
jgi:hypothetical protein